MVAEAANDVIRVGESVIVDLGRRQPRGEVIEVYGTGRLAEAMVRMPRFGPDGELLYNQEISFPVRLIRRA